MPSSATLGSEPGVLTFGSGRNPQQAFVTVHLVDRFHRKESLWDVERSVLEKLRTIPGIRFPAAFDYGATPLSTIRSTVDLMISGPDPKVLASVSEDVANRLRTVGGLTSVVPTWTLDRVEVRFLPDAEQLSFYGLDAAAVAAQVSAQVKGVPATPFRVPQQDSYPILVQSRADRRGTPEDLATLPVLTPRGNVPLSSLGRPLVPAFRSFLHPLTIMVAIPLGVVGAVWALLLTGKHQCMPSFMGMILLAGIVVKNSILLIDFIEEARGRGASLHDALMESVRVRTRPILMTAAATAVGMLPIALEWAIGLERLSPLAVVAIGGLTVSTFLTLIYVPVFYDLFETMGQGLRRTRPGAQA
ncbi:MAG: efflux RND transporter permease subunit [Deltaproteobacteria bacterium]|nr:efflux RND transporter permease subunit [Deltaproteobacteria bacterium]